MKNFDHLKHALVEGWDKTGAVSIRRDTGSSFFRLYGLRKKRLRSENRSVDILPNGAVAKHPVWSVWKRGNRLLKPVPRHSSAILFDPATKEIFWLFSYSYSARPRIKTLF